MVRNPITTASAVRIVKAVNALASSGDPSTAEDMRRWFNRSYRGVAIVPIMEGRQIMGYKLTSSVYGVELKETEVRAPVARKREATCETYERPARPAQGRADWYAKLDAILPPMIEADGQGAE